MPPVRGTVTNGHPNNNRSYLFNFKFCPAFDTRKGSILILSTDVQSEGLY